MRDFEFGDFVIVDGRWSGVVIGLRFDAIHVAIKDGDNAWWNYDRVELDEAANARRRLSAASRALAAEEARLGVAVRSWPKLRRVK